ncbi:MAG: helix-turn-helix domain-containing protein [Planctomycetota bacterium]
MAIQSISRALELMDAVASAERGLTVAEGAKAVGLKRTTVHNLLQALAEHGVVSASGRPARYRLGPTPAKWIEAEHGNGFWGRARRALADTYDREPRLGWVLSALTDGDIRRKLQRPAQNPIVAACPDTGPCHPYASALTLAYQAWCDPDAMLEFRLRYRFNEFGIALWEKPEALDAFLAAGRERGVVVPGFRFIGSERRAAIPVRDAEGRMIAQLACYALDDNAAVSEIEMIEELHRVADATRA